MLSSLCDDARDAAVFGARSDPVGNDPLQGGPDLGVIDCPNCGVERRGRLLLRDDQGRPAVVCCLACRQLFHGDVVGWRKEQQGEGI